jgi:hypothetical protein
MWKSSNASIHDRIKASKPAGPLASASRSGVNSPGSQVMSSAMSAITSDTSPRLSAS